MNCTKLFAMVGGAMVLVGTAHAQCHFVTNKAGDWDDPKVWTVTSGSCGAGAVPGANDSVRISHDVAINDSRTVRHLDIDQNKVLHITSAGDLTMANSVQGGGTINGMLEITDNFFATASSSPPITVTGTGAIVMDGCTPHLTLNQAEAVVLDNGGAALIVVDATAVGGPDAYLDGSGGLRSDSPSNQIWINFCQVGSDVQLRLDGAKLYGAVTILDGSGCGGTASFDNRGTVIADSTNGAIVFDQSLKCVTDTAAANCTSARWRADAGGTLEFDVAASLASPFRVSGDVFLGAPVTTSGNLQLNSGGCITASSSDPFSYSGTCGGACNPGSPITVCYCCQ